MPPVLVGGHPFEKNKDGKPRFNMGEVFPAHNTVAFGNGTHQIVREDYVDYLNAERAKKNISKLSFEKEIILTRSCVDLVVRGDFIYIRPKPTENGMKMAFEADRMLQEIVPEQRIKFMGLDDPFIRQAVKKRGELWRISSLPRTRTGKKQLIRNSKIHIQHRKMYYHNAVTGTKYLTYWEFEKLGRLKPTTVGRCLKEITAYLNARNHLNQPELLLFKTRKKVFTRKFLTYDYTELPPRTVMTIYAQLRSRFREAVESVEFLKDDPNNQKWCQQMLNALVKRNDEISEEISLGLCPEFFMHIKWLPGAYIIEGELVFDPIFDKKENNPHDSELARLCDEKVKKLIFNYMREFSNIEYINVGRIIESASKRVKMPGRRDVYIAVIKIPEKTEEVIKFIRMQKFGIKEFLEEGHSLFSAMVKSEKYIEYVLDRHAGCKQLGMNLLPFRTAKVSEKFHGVTIGTNYIERNYVHGFATDKLSVPKLKSEKYCCRFFELLGQAAAINLVVGRSYNKRVLFDDGDEVVLEDRKGMPREVLVSSVTGSFEDYNTELDRYADQYAVPVNKRRKLLGKRLFRKATDVYITSLEVNLLEIKKHYKERQRAFDMLFHDRENTAESFRFKWERVLDRLDRTDAHAFAEKVRRHIDESVTTTNDSCQ